MSLIDINNSDTINDQLTKLLSAGALITFLIFVLIFMILTIILNHHWKRYGVATENVKKIRLWYFSVSLILFFIMVIALFSL